MNRTGLSRRVTAGAPALAALCWLAVAAALPAACTQPGKSEGGDRVQPEKPPLDTGLSPWPDLGAITRPDLDLDQGAPDLASAAADGGPSPGADLGGSHSGPDDAGSFPRPDLGQGPQDGAADAAGQGGTEDAARDSGGAAPPDGGGGGGPVGWTVRYFESFEGLELGSPGWVEDGCPDDGPFSDCGAFFRQQGVVAPHAWRISHPFGEDGWLTLELYSRSNARPLSDFAAVTADPAGGEDRVLRLTSPAHTDGVVVRPSQALPERYRISLDVGWADFGNGQPGDNGYDGGERAEPWLDADATAENGFYWLAILDSLPRPHNNVWIHHHRKVVLDSDNHYPPWMEIWDGRQFVSSGRHPLMLFGVSGLGRALPLAGKSFLSWAAEAWQPLGEIRAADAYLPRTWYRVQIERDGDRYTLQAVGEFAYGGSRTYTATLDAAERCIWHYNQTPLPAASPCADPAPLPGLGPEFPLWPPGGSWPDWFFFGDPHNNYYEGTAYFDDVRLEVYR